MYSGLRKVREKTIAENTLCKCWLYIYFKTEPNLLYNFFLPKCWKHFQISVLCYHTHLRINYRLLSIKYVWEWAIRQRKEKFCVILCNERGGPWPMPSGSQKGIKLVPNIGILQLIIRIFVYFFIVLCIFIYSKPHKSLLMVLYSFHRSSNGISVVHSVEC